MTIYRTATFEFAEDRLCDTGATRSYSVSSIDGQIVLTLDSVFPAGATSCDAIDTFQDPGIAIATADHFYKLAELNNAVEFAVAA